jgi:Holliday junction resolvase RusA-like endonuclease
MTTEISFPVEFHIAGTPISLQASARSRQLWRERVRIAAKAALPDHPWLTDARIAVTIFYFPEHEPQVDLDNLAKPILDALQTLFYRDDRQVDRLLVQWFDAESRIGDAGDQLAAAVENGRPTVYIRVDDEWSRPTP